MNGYVARGKKTFKLREMRLQFDTALPRVPFDSWQKKADMSQEKNR